MVRLLDCNILTDLYTKSTDRPITPLNVVSPRSHQDHSEQSCEQSYWQILWSFLYVQGN